MPHGLPRLTADAVIKVLSHHGFELVGQRGSHQKWRNEETRNQVIVPYHKSAQLPLGTLHSIISGCGLAEEEFTKS